MNERQKAQKDFESSGQNIIVGNASECPIDPLILAKTDANSSYVRKSIDSGLTAKIYQIEINGIHYTLKIKRKQALVSNLDGEFSFMNEVQRRLDFYRLKASKETSSKFKNIVETIYADYRLGIILSPWIDGEAVNSLNSDIFRQILTTTNECEKQGLMEWDLCEGNVLIDGNGKVYLFDFGYMYKFNPLTDFNSNGKTDPLFHLVERFETRFFFGWLIKQTSMTFEEQFELYRELKLVASEVFEDKVKWLSDANADQNVVSQFEQLLRKWKAALSNDALLLDMFTLESFRSHVLDVEDDLHGQSCTPNTIKRIDVIIESISAHYAFLQTNGGLFYGNKDKNQKDLIDTYRSKRALAKTYLINKSTD
ncbi:phosphotransferase [Vibrio sp. HN007]|uniref:phosphotransferase n=1 Tax=Vibrio iocasae TaxID=3098914 RepID=UPI0035D50AA5